MSGKADHGYDSNVGENDKQMGRGQPTINDVARVAGVSKKTVSRVINASPLLRTDTREKVIRVIAELGYVPNPQARALALRRNFLIGLLHDNPNAQTVLNVQEGILDVIRDTDFALVVRPVDRHSPTLVDDCRRFIERQRLFGVLFLPPISENDELARMCAQLRCGYVRMGSAQLDDPAHAVGSNDREAVSGAVDYLVAQGHRRIGLILGPPGFRSAHERATGFREAMARHGLPVPDELVAQGSYRFQSGVEAGEALLGVAERPTAIFCSNDEMAAGALHTARMRGLQVPGELSLIGFDDAPIAGHIWPPMTTVRWPIRPMARAAALKLILPDSAGGEPSRFPADLVTRASVAQPAG